MCCMMFRKGIIMTAAEHAWMIADTRLYTSLGQPGNDGQDLLTNMVSFWDFDETLATADIVDDHSTNDWDVVGDPGVSP